jgi:CheY-like chemotaxis protein
MDERAPSPARALVVDDDAACGRTLASLLSRVGVTAVETALSSDQALAKLEVSQFDLIFCDLNMPGRDGVETMRLFAERRVKSPLVIVSGADPKVLKAAQALGTSRGLAIAGILQKPFGLSDVRTTLERVATLPSPRSRRPAPKVSAEELAQAIAQNHLLLHYQPQLHLHSGQLHGTEALVRCASWTRSPAAESSARQAAFHSCFPHRQGGTSRRANGRASGSRMAGTAMGLDTRVGLGYQVGSAQRWAVAALPSSMR